jgi:hypothetical protein
MGKGKKDEEQVDISQDIKGKVQPSQDNCDPMVSHPIFRRKPNASHMCARITISHI